MVSPDKKIYPDAKSFAFKREELRNSGRILVFTNGCFDILHRGHCEYLYASRQLGDFLVVGLNTDESVRRLKGEPRPYQTLEDRAFILASLSFVDAVIPFGEDTPLELILFLRPDVLAKGADYEVAQIVGAEEIKSWGGRVERIPIVKGRSTSSIIDRVRNS